MSMMVSFVLSFFPRDVLDEILNLIESVSEDFPSYSYSYIGWVIKQLFHALQRQQSILSPSELWTTRSTIALVLAALGESESGRPQHLKR